MSESTENEVDMIPMKISACRTSLEVAGTTLRAAVPEDEAFLYKLYCSTRSQEMAAWGWNAAQQEAFLQMQFRAQQHHYRTQESDADHSIIMKDGREIGRIIVVRSDSEICLADIALLTEYRGAGIGIALIRGLFEEARESGKPVTLHVEKSNRAAGLYERLGFKKTSDAGFHYKMEWRDG
jgi:ribosomal protein S18 acetylase RimI-like enzyme